MVREWRVLALIVLAMMVVARADDEVDTNESVETTDDNAAMPDDTVVVSSNDSAAKPEDDDEEEEGIEAVVPPIVEPEPEECTAPGAGRAAPRADLPREPWEYGETHVTRFQKIHNIEYDAARNVLYATDPTNSCVMHSVGGFEDMVPFTPLVGSCNASNPSNDGPLDKATVQRPVGLAMHGSMNLFITDLQDAMVHTIRRINLAKKRVGTIAGGRNGYYDTERGIQARFNNPVGLCLAHDGKALYVADTHNNRIRKVDFTGMFPVTTVAGTGATSFMDGRQNLAAFYHPISIATASDGTLYVADMVNSLLRKIYESETAKVMKVVTIAGSGSLLWEPENPEGVSATVGRYDRTFDTINRDHMGNIFLSVGKGDVKKVTSTGEMSKLPRRSNGWIDAYALGSQLNSPVGILLIEETDTIFLSDHNNHVIRRYSLADRYMRTDFGAPMAPGHASVTNRSVSEHSNATFHGHITFPMALTINASECTIIVGCQGNGVLRKFATPYASRACLRFYGLFPTDQVCEVPPQELEARKKRSAGSYLPVGA